MEAHRVPPPHRGAQLVDDRVPPDAEYWRGRAEALSAQIDALEKLVLTLSGRLTPEQVLAAIDAARRTVVSLPPGDGVGGSEPADVGALLDRLWAHLSNGGPRE